MSFLPSSCQARAYDPFRGAINLYANVFDADSGIAYVAYWDGDPNTPGSVLLGISSDSSSSFNFVWATDPSGGDDGIHYIYARGYDRAGNYRTSPAIEIQVDSQATEAEPVGLLEIATLTAAIAIPAALIVLGVMIRKRPVAPALPLPKQSIATKPPKGA